METIDHNLAVGSLRSKYLRNFDRITPREDGGDSSSSEPSDDEATEPVQFVIDKTPHCHEEQAKMPANRTKKPSVTLSSQLQPGIDTKGTYLVTRPDRDPTQAAQKLRQLVLSLTGDELLKGSVLQPGFEKQYTVPPYVESLRRIKAERKKEREKTKGPDWFGLGAPEITEELKSDLEVLRMRAVLDPKHFYKKNDLKVLPKYFQVGTVMDSPTDFYHARVPKKDRKRTLVEELLADADFKKYSRKKYQEAMAKQQRTSRKATRHMKRLKKRKP